MAWAAVPHRLVDDVAGFPIGNGLAFRVHLGKILAERADDLLASLIGYGGWLESLNAHGLLLQYGPPGIYPVADRTVIRRSETVPRRIARCVRSQARIATR
jgi:hypothetical protein